MLAFLAEYGRQSERGSSTNRSYSKVRAIVGRQARGLAAGALDLEPTNAAIGALAAIVGEG